MLSEVLSECLDQAFDKETLRDVVLGRGLKKGVQGTDLIWKVNHRLRKKTCSKGGITQLIRECLVHINLKEIDPII